MDALMFTRSWLLVSDVPFALRCAKSWQRRSAEARGSSMAGWGIFLFMIRRRRSHICLVLPWSNSAHQVSHEVCLSSATTLRCSDWAFLRFALVVGDVFLR